MESEHADLLNVLDAMAGNPHYVIRRAELRQAEKLIVEQEQQIAALTASRSLESGEASDAEPIRDCYVDGDSDWQDPWLLSVGFRPDAYGQDFLFINQGHGSDLIFDLEAMAAGPWRLADPDAFIEIPRPKTRGDVRRLCAALGIKLKT